MAARAFDGEADEGGGRRVHHVLKSRVKIIGRVVGFIVPRAGANHAGGDDRLLIAIGHLIAGELIGHKPIVRRVVVEGVDHPVAIPPNVRFQLIALVAARLGKADKVEPVPRPAFAVLLGSKQTINQLLVGLGVFVADKCVDLFSSGRQAQQVKVRAANERALVGQRRGFEVALLKLGQNERIDRVADPVRLLHRRHRRAFHRLQRPPVQPAAHIGRFLINIYFPPRRPLSALGDPAFQQDDLGLRQLLRLPARFRRHFTDHHPFDQQAVGHLAAGDDVSGIAARQSRLAIGKI